MEELYERVKNFNVSVKEINRKVIFLRKLVRGGTEHSFGIHVAKMAGMPGQITDRAERILADMESAHRGSMRDTTAKYLPWRSMAAAECNSACFSWTILCSSKSVMKSRGWTSMLLRRWRR